MRMNTDRPRVFESGGIGGAATHDACVWISAYGLHDARAPLAYGAIVNEPRICSYNYSESCSRVVAFNL